jgi:protein O-GlcNAc transferase
MTPEQLADEANQLVTRLATSPNNVELINNLASVRRRQGFLQAAIAGFQLALQLRPDLAVIHYNLGNAYAEARQSKEGISAYQQAIHCQPNFPEAYQNLGDLLNDSGEFEQAIVCYKRSLEIRPDSVAVLSNLGNALVQIGEYHSAENYLRRAQSLSPNIPEVYNNLGRVFLELNQMTAADQAFRTAIAINPNHFESYVNLSGILALRHENEQSLNLLDQACTLQPNESSPLLGLIHQMQQVCLWDRLPQLCDRFNQLISKDYSNRKLRSSELPSPLTYISLPIETTSEQQLQCSQRWASAQFPHSKPVNELPPNIDRLQSKQPIRIGYLSSDFHDHPVGYLVPELFENHNRQRFQVFGYSLGVDLSGEVHERIVRSFDTYRDLNQLSIQKAAQTIANDKIDILIDLQAYTSRSRPAIPALRPAPIQINYLGFAGTMGADFIDYILVDDYVVPSSQQEHFQEKLIQLPQSFMVQDSKRAIDQTPQSRASFGLPEKAIVFAAFSRSFKITPAMFDCWLRILNAIPNSVLWMKSWNKLGEQRLQMRAQNFGVDTTRLVFSPTIPMPSHLACHRLADLYLDTFPYNQHSTAADALRVGLPLLTLQGKTFASRVAASFLVKLGLPELIANSLEEYEAIAIQLAKNLKELSSLRHRLEAALQSTDLFDGRKFATKVEKAYDLIWKNYHLGHKPRLIRAEELADG